MIRTIKLAPAKSINSVCNNMTKKIEYTNNSDNGGLIMLKKYRGLISLFVIMLFAITLIVSNNVANAASKTIKYNDKSYKIIEVDGGDTSGKRKANVAVDIGYGDRVYWGLTNKYGQLVYVIADKIILQDDENEPVNKSGRYYNEEANVKGTELEEYDQGHVIADSLGGVSNAYNITPQDSTLNRHGDQAYMEKVIRDAGGCTYFVATITYPDNKTQIPSHYKYTYKLKGKKVTDSFANVNPDEVNEKLEKVTPTPVPKKTITSDFNESSELKKVDTNKNGKVTIAEAKVAGFIMPITKDDWLYKYMDDRDGDGLVGE
jgi:hypothetical protein